MQDGERIEFVTEQGIRVTAVRSGPLPDRDACEAGKALARTLIAECRAKASGAPNPCQEKAR